MTPQDRIRLEHMLECIDAIGAFPHLDINQRLIRSAAIYELQSMGEAVRHVSQELKASNPNIPWIPMEGFRHRVVHEYFGVDIQAVTRALETLPEIKRLLLKALEKDPQTP